MTGWDASAIRCLHRRIRLAVHVFLVKHVYGYYSETFLCTPDQRA